MATTKTKRVKVRTVKVKPVVQPAAEYRTAPKPTARERGLTPEIKAELSAVMARSPDGLLHADDVVMQAKRPLSKLHEYFEWNDSVAAHRWRLDQARYLIQSFRIEVAPLTVTPAFVSLASDRTHGGGYRWASDVLPQAALRQELLLTVLQDVGYLLQKVADAPEIQPLIEVVTELQAQIGSK